jgi:hypothetical protein
MIKHEGNSWNVYTEDGTKKLGSHPSKQAAMKQLQAIEISKHQHEKGATKPKRQLGQR